MKIISRLIAAILFVCFFFFALRNTQEVTLHFFLGYERTDPLVLILLAFFVVGAILGVLAMTPIVFRHRREAARYKKALTQIQKQQEEVAQAQTQPPQPDSVITAQHIL
ncbi:LapA family protein [Herbaspirillum sp.]|uniref:LapA family protein n=1 Tax=Herbaspirillum sp. TaxID=1890675 RepID=UPI001B0F255A|nr:LapA family protein [Herbaspirillum sp.]MBO9538109.1 LapA family protein [Herbaspirillum sp.]